MVLYFTYMYEKVQAWYCTWTNDFNKVIVTFYKF